ncbi:hypothetical protein E8D34_00575 [Nocardioides sp. GY 10113]|uniref:hypothetical protein n=1 Tax=Nocardioides sp. GY 10113 TaxID=2569761 RepID=UPI0010A79649|nr:hypothetical protein [Nocardioides sp. GY 10113]TIC89047.1 hypothetical protein E8D34_00575 [Nocardioides sp. GY 10113]
MTGDSSEEPQPRPQPQPARRRRRTALVTSRWAASAAVIAAMTSGGAAAADEGVDSAPSGPVASAFADPPEDLDLEGPA